MAKKSDSRRTIKGRRLGPRRPLPGDLDPRYGESRVTRATANDPRHIASQAPKGFRPCTRSQEWLEAVDAALVASKKRSDFRANVRKCARVYLGYANYAQQDDGSLRALPTCSPDWQEAPARAGVSRATWGRVFAWLRSSNLLSWIAWGREAQYKPEHLQDEGNDRCVYGFLIPNRRQEEKPEKVLSETVTPSRSEEEKPTHARTRAAATRETAFASLSLMTKGGSAALRRRLLTRKDPLPSRSETAKRLGCKAPSRESQAAFAASVIRDAPWLRQISPQHLASILRKAKIFEADWTVNDVLYALDNRPAGHADGTWHHGQQIAHVPGWVRNRLRAWSDERGWPVSSKSQSDREYQEQMRQQAVATAKRLAAEADLRARNAAVARGDEAPGPGRQAFLAIREALRKQPKLRNRLTH